MTTVEGIMYKVRRCKCGATRLAVEDEQGNWKWVGGCLPCDRIERLEILLAGGVRVYSGSMAMNSPERMRRRIELAEKEIELLKQEKSRLEEDLRRARMEEKRARNSARVAHESAERVRQNCRAMIGMSLDEVN